MSPKSGLTLPQDPFCLQAPKPEVGAKAMRKTETCLKCEDEDASSTPAPADV